MSDTILYCPYKKHLWSCVLAASMGVFAFIGAGYCLPLSWVSVLFLTGMGIACLWLTKVIYDSTKRAVCFDSKGLQIIGGSYLEHRTILWEKLTYAYYARSYKGHLFLVLSPNVLSSKEAKRFANQGANSSQIYIDGVVVIYMDVLQDVSQLRALIDNQILRVDSF